jgi:putative tryptophan/tyrosine transport system substrate-binding protein
LIQGVLSSASDGAYQAEASFIQGLKANGFIEGNNISIEWRWAEAQYNRLPSLASELVRRNVAVIATFDVPSSLAAAAATKTIPIVFFSGADPVRLGLVDNFNHPSRNLTGVTSLLSSLGVKQLELLRELIPGVSQIAFLVNPVNANSLVDVSEIQAAAGALGQHLCHTPIDVMQSAENAFRDDFTAGGLRREHCRIGRCALAKRSMRTPMIEIADIRRYHSTETSFVEDK